MTEPTPDEQFPSASGPNSARNKTLVGSLIAVVLSGLVFLYQSNQSSLPDLPDTSSGGLSNLPNLVPTQSVPQGINRGVILDTDVSDLTRFEVVNYEVQFGDSLFSIAANFDITPETVLWANEDALGGNADFLEPGMELVIPPVNGVYYQWQEGDNIDQVAASFEADVRDILDWPSNVIVDLANPSIPPGEWIMIPDGVGEFKQWVIPTIPRGNAGVSASLYGPGACTGSYTGAFGTGSFGWPTTIHDLVGNDYWSGHLGIDLATGEGLPILASDSGVVVFSGWATGGYGYMVMIDHGNDYQTLYAHMSSVVAQCGASVTKGQTVGLGGSTGNSSGPHLHFEIRYLDGFVNPWFVLPPP